MEPWIGGPSNPSSLHFEGRSARSAIDRARETVSSAFGCLFGEIVFTSSGTEAANLALLGAALANSNSSRRRMLMAAAEHHCVLHTAPLLQRLGYTVDLIPVTREGQVTEAALTELIGEDVLLVSVMHVNNELGTINPVEHLAELARSRGALFHCDAVQSFPFVPKVSEWSVDLVSVSAHKLGGPPGVGALMMRSGVQVQPLVLGGGQEREMRAGTETTVGIVGFGAAVESALSQEPAYAARSVTRDRLASILVEAGFLPTVKEAPVSGGHFHCRLPSVDAESFLIRLDREGVSASSGAACSSGSLEPSHVLLACGYSAIESKEGLRFTLGVETSLEEAEEAARRVLVAKNEVLAARGQP